MIQHTLKLAAVNCTAEPSSTFRSPAKLAILPFWLPPAPCPLPHLPSLTWRCSLVVVCVM